MSELYKTIESLCAERGITGYRLCKDVGIQPSVITDLRVGRKNSMKVETADKIATYFGVSVGYLLGTEKEKALIPSDEREIDDPDIRMIARAGHKMTPEQRENLRKYAQYMYPEAFKDDDT
jgi:transcriptional regulator with XRE-family HTH domain